MFASGFEPTVFDGSEIEYNAPENTGIPFEYSYLKNLPKAFNQGSKPYCVPYSLSTYINWDLNMKNGVIDDNHIDYKSIFEGNNVNENGMTFKSAFKYLKDEGVSTDKGIFKINEFARITNPISLKYAIVANGPCFGALPVYIADGTEEFWKDYMGDLQGYHAISIVGFNNEGYIIRNSWGTSYGKNGYAFLKNEDLNKFIEIWTVI